MTKRRRRNPLVQIILIALACLLGIGSRRYAHALPGFIAAYAGDTLWALAAFLGFGLILPRYRLEQSQCSAWLSPSPSNSASCTTPPGSTRSGTRRSGGLILGFGFLWSDLVCYALGVGMGVLVDVIGGIVPGKDRS